MAFKIIRRDEPLPARNIVIIIFGEPGVYKTSTAFTANKPLLLAFDAKGLDRAVNKKDAIQFEKWADVMELMESNFIEENGYGTLIIDTGGSMLDEFLAPHIVSLNDKYGNGMGGLGLSGYGVMKDSSAKFFTQAEKKKVDIIFICHTETDKEGDVTIRLPKMTGGSRDILVQKADLMGYMEMRNNKATLEFSPTQRHAGKNCAQFPVLDIPNYETAPEKFNTFMADIIDATKKHLNRQTQAQLEAIKLVDSLRDRVAAADGIEALEVITKESESFSPIYRTQVNQFIAKRYADLIREEYFNPELVKEPKDFEALAEKLKSLPKNVAQELYDDFRKIVDLAGYKYDKTSQKYIGKDVKVTETPAIPKTEPAPAPPAAPSTPAAEKPAEPAPASPKEKKEKEKKETKKSLPKDASPEPVKADAKEQAAAHTADNLPEPNEDGRQTEEWFLLQVGRKVLRVGKGTTEEVTIKDENQAVHMYGVMQNHVGYRFFKYEPAESEQVQTA